MVSRKRLESKQQEERRHVIQKHQTRLIVAAVVEAAGVGLVWVAGVVWV